MYCPEQAEPISVGLMSSMMLICDGSNTQDRGFLSRQSSKSQVPRASELLRTCRFKPTGKRVDLLD